MGVSYFLRVPMGLLESENQMETYVGSSILRHSQLVVFRFASLYKVIHPWLFSYGWPYGPIPPQEQIAEHIPKR